MTIKQVFLVSLLFKKVEVGEGGGAYSRVALMRAWALIRGNTVCISVP